MNSSLKTVKQLYAYTRVAAIDFLSNVRKLEDTKRYFLHHDLYPQAHYSENGLPWFSEVPSILPEAPINYIRPFFGKDEQPIPTPKSWDELWTFAITVPRISEFFEVEKYETRKNEGMNPMLNLSLHTN